MKRVIAVAVMVAARMGMAGAEPMERLGRVVPWDGTAGAPTLQVRGGYDPLNVETVHGKILRIQTEVHRDWEGPNIVRVILKTGRIAVPVRLGPDWFLRDHGMMIRSKDTVEVVGSRVVKEGGLLIIAAEIRKDGKILILRDKMGFPVWLGWEGRHRPE